MKTIAVIDGFSGGPKLSEKFRLALTETGFTIIKDRAEATVLVAHSAGCHAVPQESQAKIIMLINPPYWPNRSIIKRFINNYKDVKDHDLESFGHSYYRRKRMWQAFYTITRNKYLWLGLFKDNDLSFLDLAKKTKLILVRNSNDSYCGPQIKKAVNGLPNITYSELPGIHDDYCTNPKPYIDLLLKEL